MWASEHKSTKEWNSATMEYWNNEKWVENLR
jgi:hypothetical protein